MGIELSESVKKHYEEQKKLYDELLAQKQAKEKEVKEITAQLRPLKIGLTEVGMLDRATRKRKQPPRNESLKAV